MPYVYIIKSLHHPITYVGSTSRPVSIRLEEHNKELSTFTKNYAPWKLIYCEEFDSLREARLREKYFKSAAGRRFIKKNNIVRE